MVTQAVPLAYCRLASDETKKRVFFSTNSRVTFTNGRIPCDLDSLREFQNTSF